MNEPVDAYPLSWPVGRERKKTWNRESARFDTSFARARDNIVREVEMLVGRYPKPNTIISTNIALRRDGLPLASQRQPDDPGVAVYFTYKGRQVCFACDRWKKIEDNMQAICKTIEALRGIARWGTGDMMDAAFTGFTALPPPASNWRETLAVQSGGIEAAKESYLRLRSAHHPDRGGDPERFRAVNAAWHQAQAELGA